MTDFDRNAGVVLALSGGQDSTTCLGLALQAFDRVECVSFDYGQRHRVELDAAHELVQKASAIYEGDLGYRVLEVGALHHLGAAALTNERMPVEALATQRDTSWSGEPSNVYAAKHGLPSTFVPARNVILLGLTAAVAAQEGIPNVMTGICAMDRAGYPDCRAEFADSFADTMRIALDWPDFTLIAPLLHQTKAQTFALALKVGVLPWVIDVSHTCYEGDHETKHAWGYGCGECPACETRRDGWDEFLATYKLAHGPHAEPVV